jgi:phage N-6-adenine-methyltransferase
MAEALFELPADGLEAGSVHFSSLTVEWPTPIGLFNQLNEEFDFTLDPCSTDDNAKCERHYTKAEDGLSKSWKGERVFMNPPYSEVGTWVQKAYEEDALVVALIPSRTDTRWWHRYVMQADEIRFVKGRLKFGDATNSAPFPSAIVIWNHDGNLRNSGPERNGG